MGRTLAPLSSAPGREGGLLIETVIALALGAIVLGSLASLVTSGLRWTRWLIDRSEALEVVRTTWVILGEEVRGGRANDDWRVDDSGVLQLRSFQGVARICEVDAATSDWWVAYRGRRLPDPSRDSILALRPDGRWQSLDLASSTSSPGPTEKCQSLDGESVLRWVVEGSGEAETILARTYETGSYHLVDGALRYRRGGGGRQPLTATRLSSGSSLRQLGDQLQVKVLLEAASTERAQDSFEWTTGQVR
jgi:hypothetical protein